MNLQITVEHVPVETVMTCRLLPVRLIPAWIMGCRKRSVVRDCQSTATLANLRRPGCEGVGGFLNVSCFIEG